MSLVWRAPDLLNFFGPNPLSLEEGQDWPGSEGKTENTRPGPGAPDSVIRQKAGLLQELVSHAVKRQVTEATKKMFTENRAPLAEPAEDPDRPAQEDLVSEKQARLYLQKMRKLTEEERFRLGLLR